MSDSTIHRLSFEQHDDTAKWSARRSLLFATGSSLALWAVIILGFSALV